MDIRTPFNIRDDILIDKYQLNIEMIHPDHDPYPDYMLMLFFCDCHHKTFPAGEEKREKLRNIVYDILRKEGFSLEPKKGKGHDRFHIRFRNLSGHYGVWHVFENPDRR